MTVVLTNFSYNKNAIDKLYLNISQKLLLLKVFCVDLYAAIPVF